MASRRIEQQLERLSRIREGGTGDTTDALREALADCVNLVVAKAADPEVRDEASLALGSARLPGAVERLQEAWSRAQDRQFREVLLRAMSASRQACAIEFLLNVIRDGRAPDLPAAIEALALHRDSAEIRQRVWESVKEAGAAAREKFRESLGEIPSQEADGSARPG